MQFKNKVHRSPKAIYAFQLLLTHGAILAIILLGTFYRFQGLSHRNIWYDEALTVVQAEKSIAQINKDVPTPVHYYFVHYFLLLGKNTSTLGLPSVILGVLSIYVIYLTGVRIKNKTLGLLSAFLLSISPMHIEYSQQILFYSYYVFFSLMTLYFLIRFLEKWRESRFSYTDLALIIVFCVINIFTQAVSLVLTATTALILLIYFLSQPKTTWKYKYMFLPVTAAGAAVLVLLQSIRGGAYIKFLSDIRLDPKSDIPIGWSLSHQLSVGVLHFDMRFFLAMASWFGLGNGKPLTLYLSLALLGVLSFFISKKSRYYFSSIVMWIVIPFVFLYLFRRNHWFEEKYFIFVLPVYLIVVASGIEMLLNILPKLTKNPMKSRAVRVVSTVFIIIAILGCAQIPIRTRASFGFPTPNYRELNWRKVYDYLSENMRPGDKIVVPRDSTLFLEFYMPKGSLGTKLSDEKFLTYITSKEYSKLATEGFSYFYVCPEDYRYYYPYSATVFKDPKGVGNYGIYNISFVKKSPIPLLLRPDTQIYYYDDFKTSKYLAEAEKWVNVANSYWGSSSMPPIQCCNVLAPIKKQETYIDYSFLVPKDITSLRLVPQFEIGKNVQFKILAGKSEQDLGEIYSNLWTSPGYYKPEIILTQLNTVLYLRFTFSYSGETENLPNDSFLKSFGLFPTTNSGVLASEFSKSTDPKEKYKLMYSAELSVVKDVKWEADSIQNIGWWQDLFFGYLFKQHEMTEENPLIFRFNLGQKANQVNVELQTIETKTNTINVYYREGDGQWNILKNTYMEDYTNQKFTIQPIDSETLDLKFETSVPGESAKIRDLKVYVQ